MTRSASSYTAAPTRKLQVYQYGDPELNSGWDWCGTVRNAGHDNIELKGSTGISMEYDPDDHWDATSWYGYDDTEKRTWKNSS